ncbi:MAG: N-acetylglucosamine-6-phosphate deacetylase [Clostridia bacterium]|nr:N-acetylglucosamine-6-phosphate deacetylase [Clostridia bacterium]MBR3680515.1 N-acetylglucosamine-6-phosphate deacetylase [Clostridia bacterium]
MKYRIHGGSLVTDTVERADLLISDGKIEAIIPTDAPSPREYEIIDAVGCYVSAGFVDIHQHGGGGADYMDGRAEDFYLATSAHLAHGTTSVMPTLLSADTEGLMRAIGGYKAALSDPRIKANLLGIHIEGPYISPKQAGAQKPEHIRKFNPEEYTAIADFAEGNIRRWSVAPEVEGAADFAKFAEKRGIALSIAHSDADLDTAREAFRLGYRHITHFYSCISTVTRRNGYRVAGLLEAGYLMDGMDVEIIADGSHIPPDLLRYVMKFKSSERIALITDAMRAAGQSVSESFLGSALDPLPVIVEDGVAKLTDRSAFAGSVATADMLIKTMLKIDTPLPVAVKMLTVNPLRMMKLDVNKGLLKAGYDADVCIFDEGINVKAVLVMGEVAYRA